MAPDATNNSYLLQIDNNTCYTVGDSAIAANAWTWVDYQGGSAASKIAPVLTAGSHTVKLIGREAGVKLDRVLAVSDTACVPTGLGDNCTVQADTTAPAVDLTTPASGATVSGQVNVAATASDAKGVSKVEFYVNNQLQSTDTTAPYGFTWNTAALANGTYSVTAKAYDAAGNVGGPDGHSVSVKNGDAQAPSVPGNVKATADAYNKVTLTWNASTDNVAVTGYTVNRNGAFLATTTTPSYVDNSVVGGTTYSYQIIASDAAGNKSAASTASLVQTPAAPVSDTQAPSVPTAVVATAQSTSQINISWNASTDNVVVKGYDVYRTAVGGNPFKLNSSLITGTSFADTGLNANTQYSYYVIAKDASGNASQPSQTALATTQSMPTPDPETPDEEVPDPTVVRGKVTDRRGKALQDVQVVILQDGKRYVATTNNRGVYRIEAVPAGRYVAKYKLRGYETETETFRLREGKTIVQNVRLYKNGQSSGWWSWWWRW